MAYNIAYKASVKKDLKKLSKAEARRILDQIEKTLPKKADSYPTLKGEFAGLRKFCAGNYRVVFVLLDDDVVILKIGDRKDVYK